MEDYKAISPINLPETHLWWLALADKLRTFTKQHTKQISILAERTDLEKDFDLLVKPLFDSPVTIIYQENTRMEEMKADIAILEEIARPPDCTDISLFRITRISSLNDLRNSFDRQGLQLQYPLVHMYLQIYEEFNRLQALSPVVELSNYLLDQLSHRLLRNEAAGRHISELLKTEPQLKNFSLHLKLGGIRT